MKNMFEIGMSCRKNNEAKKRDALVHVFSDAEGTHVRLTGNVAKVRILRNGYVQVIGKANNIFNPVSITSENGSVSGINAITGKPFTIRTSPAYLKAAREAGIPIYKPGLLGKKRKR